MISRLAALLLLLLATVLIAQAQSFDGGAPGYEYEMKKRFRAEPVRFGKRAPREPVRFGKRSGQQQQPAFYPFELLNRDVVEY